MLLLLLFSFSFAAFFDKLDDKLFAGSSHILLNAFCYEISPSLEKRNQCFVAV